MPFPYTPILRQALAMTRDNLPLWVFGIFASFATPLTLLLLLSILGEPSIFDSELSQWSGGLLEFWKSPWTISNLAALMFAFFVSALCRGALIWSGQKIADRQEVTPRQVLISGQKHAGAVLGLQMTLSIVFLVILTILIAPVIYLATLGEVGRTVALSFLGLGIWVPVSILLGLMFLHGPVIIVLYHLTLYSALQLAFSLAKSKLKESLVMGTLVLGINLGFMAVLGFGIILLGVPIAFFSLVLAKLGLAIPIYVLILGGALLAGVGMVVLSAGLVVFNNFTWTLAVREMIKTEKHGEPVKNMAPETGPAA